MNSGCTHPRANSDDLLTSLKSNGQLSLDLELTMEEKWYT